MFICMHAYIPTYLHTYLHTVHNPHRADDMCWVQNNGEADGRSDQLQLHNAPSDILHNIQCIFHSHCALSLYIIHTRQACLGVFDMYELHS